VVGVVTVVDDKLLGWGEVALDAIHPGRVGSCKDQFDVVARTPVDHFLLRVSFHVVQDDV
jgi:hypothetical protein